MNDSCCFLLLKNEAVNKRHLTRNFDVTRFCCHIDLKHTSSREEGVKIIRFSRGGVIYGWPLITLSKNVRAYVSNIAVLWQSHFPNKYYLYENISKRLHHILFKYKNFSHLIFCSKCVFTFYVF